MKLKHITLALLFFAVFSCAEENDTNPQLDLEGTWQWINLPADTGNKSVQNFRFGADSTASYQVLEYYKFEGQTEFELLGEVVYEGRVKIDGKELDFDFDQIIVTEHQFDQDPETSPFDRQIFQDSSYEINGDTLLMTWTSFPAGFPVIGTVKYLRVE